MALKVTFDKEMALKEQMDVMAKMEFDILRIMKFAGERFVKDARSMSRDEGGFGDITGNLRASIGYFILKDGKVVEENFEDQRQMAKLAAEVVLATVKRSSRYKLVGVAGMAYASAVEARGLNVISIQAEAAIINLDRYFREMERKYRA